MRLSLTPALLFLAGVTLATAVSAATTEEVLARLDASAPKFQGMTANVERVTYTKVLDEKSTEWGTVRLRKVGKQLQAYVEITKPDPRTLAFAGRKLEIYYPKMSLIQEYDLGKSGLADQYLMVGFGTSGRDLKATYKISLAGEETVSGEKTWHLSLIPTTGALKNNFRSVDLWIDQNTASVVQQKFIDPSGDYYQFTYSDVKLNPPLTEDALKLKAPKGTKRETPQK